MLTTPSWLDRLPLAAGKRTVIVDNDVLSSYLFLRPPPTDDVRYLFESGSVRVQCGRQVIDEALNHPGLNPNSRRTAWESLGKLQANGRLFLSGATQMTPAMSAVYAELARLLAATNLSQTDARVLADAIVKRIPLLTLERRSKEGLAKALANAAVQRHLTQHGLPTASAAILV
jgi:hypothetical protein